MSEQDLQRVHNHVSALCTHACRGVKLLLLVLPQPLGSNAQGQRQDNDPPSEKGSSSSSSSNESDKKKTEKIESIDVDVLQKVLESLWAKREHRLSPEAQAAISEVAHGSWLASSRLILSSFIAIFIGFISSSTLFFSGVGFAEAPAFFA